MNNLSTFAAQLRQFILQDRENLIPSDSPASDQWFGEAALKLFALQFEHNLAYRGFCEGQGKSPETTRAWFDVPAIPAAAFKEWDVTALPVSERTHVFHSSGTTGHRPSRHFHSAESIQLYEQSLLSGFEKNVLAGVQDRPRMIFLTPSAAAAPHSSLVHMFAAVAEQFGAAESTFIGSIGPDGAWELDTRKAAEILEKCVAIGRPICVLGTAFLFVHLLEYLERQPTRLVLPPGSRVMETGGYKGRSRALAKGELHALIRRQLGVEEIVCEYGMSELSSQAYANAGVFHFPSWARVRVVSPETNQEVADGQVGLIQIFDLANVYSALAVQTQDLAVRRGTVFELLGRAVTAEPRGCSLMAV